MELKSMRFQDGEGSTHISSDPASGSGSSATSGESSVPNNVPTKDKRISVGWHWTYGWLRRPECDEAYGYAYEEPSGDMVFIPNVDAAKRVMLECREDAKTGERYVCLHKDK